MSDEAKLSVVNDAIQKAVLKQYCDVDVWQRDWLNALRLAGEFIAPPHDISETRPDPLGQIRMLINLTIQLLEDETNGAAQHFYSPAQNRPPMVNRKSANRVWLLTLVAACRRLNEMEGYEGNAVLRARDEVRARGGKITEKEIRSILSNASRMAQRDIDAVRSQKAHIQEPGFDPRELVKIIAEHLSRQKSPL